jgi:hypothetical protein
MTIKHKIKQTYKKSESNDSFFILFFKMLNVKDYIL